MRTGGRATVTRRISNRTSEIATRTSVSTLTIYVVSCRYWAAEYLFTPTALSRSSPTHAMDVTILCSFGEWAIHSTSTRSNRHATRAHFSIRPFSIHALPERWSLRLVKHRKRLAVCQRECRVSSRPQHYVGDECERSRIVLPHSR